MRADATTYLLTWNPKKTPWDTRLDRVEELRNGKASEIDWSTGRRKSLNIGDHFFFMKQGKGACGIIGSGTFRSKPWSGRHWSDKSKKANYAYIQFETLLDSDSQPILGITKLHEIYDKHGIWNAQSSGIKIPVDVVPELRRQWNRITNNNIKPQPDMFAPSGKLPVGDKRLKALANIILRQGQSRFRQSLIDCYDGTCQVTGCRVEAVIQACHLLSVRNDGNDTSENGLLLRIDIHVLFDSGLIGINPQNMKVCVSKRLANTEYAQFHGKKLITNGLGAPNMRALKHRWKNFQRT